MHNVGFVPQHGARGSGWCVGLSKGIWSGFVYAGRRFGTVGGECIIGTLKSYSSDLPASLSLTEARMTVNAPWLAHGPALSWVPLAGAVKMGVLRYSRSLLGTSPSFPHLCLLWLWSRYPHFTTTTWIFLSHFPCPSFLSVPHGMLS